MDWLQANYPGINFGSIMNGGGIGGFGNQLQTIMQMIQQGKRP